MLSIHRGGGFEGCRDNGATGGLKGYCKAFQCSYFRISSVRAFGAALDGGLLFVLHWPVVVLLYMPNKIYGFEITESIGPWV